MAHSVSRISCFRVDTKKNVEKMHTIASKCKNFDLKEIMFPLHRLLTYYFISELFYIFSSRAFYR